ncbi:hypothetical protein FACS1894158_14110 [Betaproteobacteria bacterium]|nr:hypothetical protein FACS1894158_14110 [Betaproteobacteria bacterium]
MSFFSHFFGGKTNSTTERNETVQFDDTKVTRTMRDGRQETIQWSELKEVAVITTDEGPFVDDVFWVLSGADTGCLVPGEADGAKELLARLQKLPGFNNEAAILAMGSTENAKFVCWSKQNVHLTPPLS